MSAVIGKVSTAPEVSLKVSVPPRRRSATLGVPLDEDHDAKATVNVKTVRLSVTSRSGRYVTTNTVTVPRDDAALKALIALLEAVRNEVNAQEMWAAEDAEERAALTELN